MPCVPSSRPSSSVELITATLSSTESPLTSFVACSPSSTPPLDLSLAPDCVVISRQQSVISYTGCPSHSTLYTRLRRWHSTVFVAAVRPISETFVDRYQQSSVALVCDLRIVAIILRREHRENDKDHAVFGVLHRRSGTVCLHTFAPGTSAAGNSPVD